MALLPLLSLTPCPVAQEYRRAAGYDLEPETAIIMNPNAIVVPEEFSDMWRTLSVVGSFACSVRPKHGKYPQVVLTLHQYSPFE